MSTGQGLDMTLNNHITMSILNHTCACDLAALTNSLDDSNSCIYRLENGWGYGSSHNVGHLCWDPPCAHYDIDRASWMVDQCISETAVNSP